MAFQVNYFLPCRHPRLRPFGERLRYPGIEAMARALYLYDRVTVAQVFASCPLKGEQIANEL